MADKGFDLGDYIEVKERIRVFYESYAGGRLVTERVYTELGPDGTPRVVVEAAAYRSVDDPLPGRGWSWMNLPGTTSYTRGSELENTETSAWGRAIAATGILIDRSIASANEVRNKQGEDRPAANDPLIGFARVGDASTSDFVLRPDPAGVPHLGFRLEGEKGGILVEASGKLADQLYDARYTVIGKRVSAWGKIEDRSFPGKGGRTTRYQALVLARLTGPDGIALPQTGTSAHPDAAGNVPPEPTAQSSAPISRDDFLAALESYGIPPNLAAAKSADLFPGIGPKDLTDAQRGALLAELTSPDVLPLFAALDAETEAELDAALPA